MKRRVRSASLFVLLSGASSAHAATPIKALVAFCSARVDGSDTTGAGLQPTDRGLDVSLVYEVAADGTDVAAALQATTNIALCYGKPGTLLVQCQQVPIPTASSVAPTANAAKISTTVTVPLDWNQASVDGTEVWVRVNGVDQASNGACWAWTVMAAKDTKDAFEGKRFQILGMNAANGLKVCNAGSRYDWLNDTALAASNTNPPPNMCFSRSQADYVAVHLQLLESSQRSRIQAQLSLTQLRSSFLNGLTATGTPLLDVDGKPLPYRAQVGPRLLGGGSAPGGGFVSTEQLHYISAPPLDGAGTPVGAYPLPAVAFGSARDVMREHTHELAHAMEQAFRDRDPVGAAESLCGSFLNGPPLFEAIAESEQHTLCLTNYPGVANSSACVSGGKAFASQEKMPDSMQQSLGGFLLYPSHDALNKLVVPPKSGQQYAGALLQYAYEQFSYPKSSVPHPSGLDPAIARKSGALSSRDSDEGVDLLGLIHQACVGKAPGPTTLELLDGVLTSSLGRSLTDVVADFHTALFLKDYTNNAVDGRFRFEWIGDFGANAQLAKPFAIDTGPGGLYSATNWFGRPDLVPRAFRVLDDWGTCTPTGTGFPNCVAYSPATRPSLKLGEGKTGLEPVELEPRGAAAFSIHPNMVAGSAGSMLGKSVVFRAGGIGAAPLFRVFRIEGNPALPGTPLTPVPLCGVSPQPACAAGAPTPDEGWAAEIAIPLTVAATDEVLVIASNAPNDATATFHWRFGTPQPVFEILDPTASSPALIGNAAHPSPAVITAVARAADGTPFPIPDKSAIHVTVSAAGAPVATYSCGNFGPCPFQALVAGANLYIALTLPASAYPATGTALDLSITLDGIPDAASQAQSLQTTPATIRTAGVAIIDKSGSMDTPSWKLNAAHIVANAWLQAQTPPDGAASQDRVGVVSFDGDSHVVVPGNATTDPTTQVLAPVGDYSNQIFGIEALGTTSIGEGLLRGQAMLDNTYDAIPVGSWPHRQAMLLLTDGANTDGLDVDTYVFNTGLDSSLFKNGDASGSWGPSPVTRGGRTAAGVSCGTPPLKLPCRLPTVSTVGIGPDADMDTLETVAKFCGGVATAIDVPVEQLTLEKGIIGLGDAVFAAANHSVGLQRIAALTVADLGSTPDFAVEPDADELRVTILGQLHFDPSVLSTPPVLTLVSPSGRSVAPVSTSPAPVAYLSTVFRVMQPEPGAWHVQVDHAAGTPSQFFVEAATRSPSTLVAVAEVPFVQRSGATALRPVKSVGSPIALRATVASGRDLGPCAVRATITRPDQTVVSVDLSDDGRHGDGAAGDGVLGATFVRTALPGNYGVRFDAACGADRSFTRTSRVTTRLGTGADRDSDGMPDAYELRYGLNPDDASDALTDADGDGLSNLAELDLGTDPTQSDTDQGGEADGSEVARGLDPRLAGDDRIGHVVPSLTPGNGRVRVALGMHPGGATVEVERAANGRTEAHAVREVASSGVWVDTGLTNEAEICYRFRATRGDATSGWSTRACLTPRVDPYPPRIDVHRGLPRSHSRAVDVSPWLIDPSVGLHTFEGEFAEPASGVDAVRVSSTGDLANAMWIPVVAPTNVRFPDGAGATSLTMQARDFAGNLSPILVIANKLVLDTPLDLAIHESERAEDQATAGDVAAAGASLDAAIAHVKVARADVGGRMGSCFRGEDLGGDDDPVTDGCVANDVHVIRVLSRVHVALVKARASLKKNPATALQLIAGGLIQARALAVFVDDNRLTL